MDLSNMERPNIQINGVIRPMNDEEYDKWILEEPKRIEIQSNQIRKKRNELLGQCDWTQTLDAPVDQQVWASYRQELRDIPQQSGFPLEVDWPEIP